MDDVTEENTTLKEMREKIVELNYSLSQQRDVNAKMRQWLDASDDDMAMLRSENAVLRKQVSAQEKIISKIQQVETEPCRSLQANDLDEKRCSEKKIQEMEKESTMMKEQNKKLTAELKSLQQERDQDKLSLLKSKAAFQTLEALRLTNQELREQLEDRLDEASLATEKDLIGGKEGSLSPPLSFALEMKLLASTAEVKNNTSDSADLTQQEETEAEEQQKPQSLTVDLQIKRCAGILETAVQKAEVFLLSVIILTVLAFLASGSFTGNFFSINNLWSSAYLMLQPYCSVHYGVLPPV